ncbi:MAG: ATP-binding cassette domain-containing protein [Promethearchaeota archaeon]
MRYGLVGPNGSGNTTTISTLLNILSPDRGELKSRSMEKVYPKGLTRCIVRLGLCPKTYLFI